MKPSEKLAQMGLSLPQVSTPVGMYVPALKVGEWVYTSGQVPFREGKVAWTGKVGREQSLESAREAARQCGLNALAAIAQVCGGLDAIQQIVKVGVFVNSADGFTDQPKVANGASELFGELFGDRGKHARSAVGVNELPLNATVEVEVVAMVA